jgi:hypothetical protein
MKITNRQLKTLIGEVIREGNPIFKHTVPEETQHEMRVIHLMGTLVAMKRRGHTNEELIPALEEVITKLRGEANPEEELSGLEQWEAEGVRRYEDYT